MAQIPFFKGSLLKGPYKPICRDWCHLLFNCTLRKFTDVPWPPQTYYIFSGFYALKKPVFYPQTFIFPWVLGGSWYTLSRQVAQAARLAFRSTFNEEKRRGVPRHQGGGPAGSTI